MYDPAAHHVANPAFLWPAFAAAAVSEMAAFAAKQFTSLAVGQDKDTIQLRQQWATPHKLALELETVQLRDFSAVPSVPGRRDAGGCVPALVCAPLALHGAAIADLASGHSLVAALRDAGLMRLFLTDWRSATAEMQFLGIDNYLADLNVLVDQIGPPIDLIGLCQGGWMALIYAARFPAKVRKLVLAAAPVDIAAAASPLSSLAAASPLAMFQELVRLGDGRMPGRQVQRFWGPEAVEAELIGPLLQTEHDRGSPAFAELETAFRDWHSWTLDLPGRFFLEVVEKLYKRNELATGSLTALGQRIELGTVKVPIFLLAAGEDELVAPPQLFAVEDLVGTEPDNLRKAVAPCRHVGLFVGKRILQNAWLDIVHWLAQPPHLNSTRAGAPLRAHAQ